ncbi:MAG: cytochrome c [Woeseiaceae bacterium]
MSIKLSLRNLAVVLAMTLTAATVVAEDIAHERHELMEGVRDATKPVGAMLKGEKAFDADTLQASLAVFADAAGKLGDMVPEGSEGGEASPAIWEDPDGFAAKIKEWQDAIATAVAADPQSLDDAKPVVGPVLKSCKSCHDGYRVEDD